MRASLARTRGYTVPLSARLGPASPHAYAAARADVDAPWRTCPRRVKCSRTEKRYAIDCRHARSDHEQRSDGTLVWVTHMLMTLGAGTLLLVVCACGETEAPADPTTTGQAPLETYRDGCGEAECGATPAPAHRCVGGYELAVCTKARGACSWQVDCAAEPPAGYNGNVGVGPCDLGEPAAPSKCGALPTYDEKECVWGFVGTPQCESYDMAACEWSHRCRPEPCDRKGTCNILDRSKVGQACNGNTPCPEGSECASISVNIGEYVETSCIQGNPCAALACAAGSNCLVLESSPAQILCSK